MKEDKKIKNINIDDLDKKIINVINNNSRLSYREIGKKVGVSVVTILKRIKVLESGKIIKKYSAKIDYDLLGYDVPVLIRIIIEKGKLFEVEKKIATHPNVLSIYDTTGDFDALVIARFKNRISLDKFLKKIQSYDFIIKTETSLILNEIKNDNILVN